MKHTSKLAALAITRRITAWSVGVGVITHLHVVSRHGLQLMVVIVLSTWLGLAVTAWVLRRLMGSDGAAERADD